MQLGTTQTGPRPLKILWFHLEGPDLFWGAAPGCRTKCPFYTVEHRHKNTEILHLMYHQVPFWCHIRCKTFLLETIIVSKPWKTRGSAWQPAPFGNYCVAFCEPLHNYRVSSRDPFYSEGNITRVSRNLASAWRRKFHFWALSAYSCVWGKTGLLVTRVSLVKVPRPHLHRSQLYPSLLRLRESCQSLSGPPAGFASSNGRVFIQALTKG